jgi:hypothetical protein
MRTALRPHTGHVCLGLLIALANSVACGSSAHQATGSTHSPLMDASAPSPVIAVGDDDDASAFAEDAAAPEGGDAEGTSVLDPSAIYVAPTGSDTAVGSPTAPLATVKAGIALATARKKTLYLCAATYAESVTITSQISIDGGVDCTNGWAWTTNSATLAPQSGIPLTINAGSAPVQIAHVAAKAADNYSPSASSIAAFVSKSTTVVLEYVQLTAGNAGDGQVPVTPSSVTTAAPTGAAGTSLSEFGCSAGALPVGNCGLVATGGRAQYGGCYGVGGNGGVGGNAAVGFAAGPGNTGVPVIYGGAGGKAVSIYPGPGQGLPGGAGSDGTEGAPPTSGIGAVTAVGYTASNAGSSGSQGQPGGGGGGGAGGYSGTMGELCETSFLGGGGGQGGFGGCGGAPAPGGGAGGASIALLTFDSAVQVIDAILNTAAGGNGSNSVAGAAGQPGGSPGAGGEGSHAVGYPSCTNSSTSGNADTGGPGGRGGKGGAGGPGGGGPSIGILAVNGSPQISTATYNTGSGGAGGKAVTGPDGADGQTGGLVVTGAGVGAQSRKGE